MVNCPYCNRDFTNAKRHATHVSACKSNPRSETAMASTTSANAVAPTTVELNGAQFFRADELVAFYPGAKGGRDVLEKAGVPADMQSYATLAPKRGLWTASTDGVKVARALVRADWALKNVAGLNGNKNGGGGSAQATQVAQRPSVAEVTETLRLKTAELDLGRAQIALLSAQANERRAVELHAKEIESLNLRTRAYIMSLPDKEDA